MADINWDVVEAAVQRGIHDYARAYWIPANFILAASPTTDTYAPDGATPWP